MEKNTQLPVEVVEKIKQEGQEMLVYAPDNKYSYIKGATAYATKLHQANETIKVLTYDNNKLKGEAEVYKIAVEELKGQNDKLKEKATGWRPLLEEVLHDWDSLVFEMQLKDKITKFLYGE